MIDVLIMSPADYVTGGVELLHQLCAEMSKHEGIRAKMLYRNAVAYRSPQPKEYEEYGCDYITQLPQDYSGYIVFPEIWANDVTESQYDKCKPVIFWESVDNYFQFCKPKDYFKFLERSGVLHLTQSVYASRFLFKLGHCSLFIGDYINDDFFSGYDLSNRSPWVLYNPIKGWDFTKKLIEYCGDEICFKPIRNLSRNEVINLMKHSMVYIDFGDHPGKDRLPREAAMCGCCIITGKNGAAGNYTDVNIKDDYKFTRWDQSLYHIKRKILSVLDNYEYHHGMFADYRNSIRGEKSTFQEKVEHLCEWWCKNEKI